MFLTRCTPSNHRRHDHFANSIDRFLSDFMSPVPSDVDTKISGAAADIVETDADYRIAVELPGLGKDDFEITLKDGVLELSAEKKREETTDDGKFHRRERVFGRIERRFSFGGDIRPDGVDATYRDGVLEIVVPKAEGAKPRTVEVTVR